MTTHPLFPRSPIKTLTTNGHAAVEKARRRPALSCAECRRLKLKCDRVWPCGQCKKRGCAQICPDGHLVPGKGNRFILANTEELHDRIDALEEALQKTVPGHPLLKASLYPYRTSPVETSPHASSAGNSSGTAGSSSPGSMHSHPEDLIDNIGTLAVGDDGHYKYFGNGAGSEFFAPEEAGSPFSPSSLPSPVSTSLSLFAGTGPTQSKQQLCAYLPPVDEARALCNNFFQHAAWLYDVVNQQQFENEIFVPTFYGNTTPSAHRLSLLFMILAVGALFDLSRPLHNPQADQFYEVAQECLRCDGGAYSNTTLPAIQAVQLMTHYVSNSPRKTDAETGWAQLGVLIKLAQSMGLHRDAARWDFPPEELEMRRKVFWEIHTHEVYTALCFGRPYSMHRSHIDCALPNDPTARMNPDGSVGFGFHTIKYFLCDKVMRIIDEVFCVTPPSYDTILALDRDIRDFQKTLVPEYLREPEDGHHPVDEDVTTLLQRQVITCFLNEALLYLHRGCFTRAIVENPSDPTATRFSPSFVATHRSSCTIIRAVLDLALLQPALVKRLSVYWFHAFSAAVVLATICIRSPRCALAPSAFRDLTAACDFFAAAEPQSRVAQGLPLLQRLHAKAVRAMAEAGFMADPGLVQDMSSDDEQELNTPGPTIKKESPDECALLGYRTRLDRTSPPRSRDGPLRLNGNPLVNIDALDWSSIVQPPQPNPRPFTNAHPSLLEYLQSFNNMQSQPTAMSTFNQQTYNMEPYTTRSDLSVQQPYLDSYGQISPQQQSAFSFTPTPSVEVTSWENYITFGRQEA
ncbi:hypothetical protein DACRYDRAFT_21143 [Dacryopinax primogenitus]|uniref:Zn(2)-C6 fungal-type domain-containing protein n=1 Tax=Dacryopinax primogenitus (strain DJM 731) TaxID=1858805 RepID=M5GC04_DACPD|nr:uncharacterized protein DACRYDRAFT_21143 [Dacryopinax primogenitus]EJU03612.1 hypothetical protein DACRYDRAFT_21143 [Dacryopinax primogenitus]